MKPFDYSTYRPMWSVSGPGLDGRLYKHFAGKNAATRAARFARRLGPGHRVTPGMGNRSGWVSLDRWNELVQQGRIA